MERLRKRLPVIQADIYSIIYKLLHERDVAAVYKIINDKSVDRIKDPEFQRYKRVDKCRIYFTRRVSWAIPSETAIEEILDFADGETILEVGAGRGLWGGLLRATTANPDQIITTEALHYEGKVFTNVLKMKAAEALKAFPEAGVLMSVWPNGYSEEFTLDNFKGDKLVYVGEEDWGCTSFEGLFKPKFNREWELVKEADIPKWPYIFDKLYLYRRKS